MVVERAVKDRTVVIAALEEAPRPLGVDALIVVQGACSKVGEAQRDREPQNRGVRDEFPAQGNLRREHALERSRFPRK